MAQKRTFGAASGAVTLVRATAVAEFYGPNHYDSIGGVGMFVTRARTLVPLGGYSPVLWTLTLGSALAAVSMFLAHRLVPPLRVQQYSMRRRLLAGIIFSCVKRRSEETSG